MYVPNTVKAQGIQETHPEILDTTELPTILTDEDLSKLYTCKQDVRNDTALEVSQYDANILLKISRQEGGGTLDGQLWTMRTILNRVFNEDFEDTVWEVVSTDKQFEVFTNGSYINADVNSNSHLALAMIEGGWNKTEGALYWRTEDNCEGSWHENNLTYIKTVEGNRYYK